MNKSPRLITVRVNKRYVRSFAFGKTCFYEQAIQKAVLFVMNELIGSDVSPWPYIYEGSKLVFNGDSKIKKSIFLSK
jgi:hypothetical protein